ncbi:unnamed protein product, partial [Larinioides sclopetarius]
SFSKWKNGNKNISQNSEDDDDEKPVFELSGNVKLDNGTMQSWLTEGSDDSAMSSCKEPLIPQDDESDMEEFSDHK